MYISPDPQAQHGTYFNLVRDIVTAVPSAWPIIEGINNNILNGDLYRALKEARKLIAYEKKLRDQYKRRTCRAATSARPPDREPSVPIKLERKRTIGPDAITSGAVVVSPDRF